MMSQEYTLCEKPEAPWPGWIPSIKPTSTIPQVQTTFSDEIEAMIGRRAQRGRPGRPGKRSLS